MMPGVKKNKSICDADISQVLRSHEVATEKRLLSVEMRVETGSRGAPYKGPRAKHNDPLATAMALWRQQEACVCNCA